MLQWIKFALLSMIVACSAFAGEATLTWTAPTTNEDGSALTDLAGYRIYYGTSETTMTTQIQLANPGLLTYVVPNLTPATWYFNMTAYTTANRESAHTNFVTKTIEPTIPNPPPDLYIQGTDVYTLTKQRDTISFLRVGSAPAGTKCITSQHANEYYVIPRASVTFSGTVRPEVVFARCQ